MRIQQDFNIFTFPAAVLLNVMYKLFKFATFMKDRRVSLCYIIFSSIKARAIIKFSAYDSYLELCVITAK